MSYEGKVQSVRELIATHNSQVSDESKKVDSEAFLSALSEIGGTTEETISECKWEDLEGCGLPKLLARKVAVIFREKEQKEDKVRYVKMSQAKAMTLKQLIESYDPREPDNNVGKILKSKADSKPFIVFQNDGSVNVDGSLVLLKEIREGHAPREHYPVEGVPHQVYSIGDRPNKLADVNPLYTGEALRPDGSCSQTSRSWSGVEREIRQIIFLARTQTKEIVLNSSMDAHNILDLAVSDGALSKVRTRFPKAVIKLQELREVGNEPSLRMPIGKQVSQTSNDPFFGATKHRRT